MRNRFIVCSAACAALCCFAGAASAELLYATNGTSISRFDSASLGSITSVPITGLQAGETFVDIDVRPASPGTLYGIGSMSRVYTVNPLLGTATQVGTA